MWHKGKRQPACPKPAGYGVGKGHIQEGMAGRQACFPLNTTVSNVYQLPLETRVIIITPSFPPSPTDRPSSGICIHIIIIIFEKKDQRRGSEEEEE